MQPQAHQPLPVVCFPVEGSRSRVPLAASLSSCPRSCNPRTWRRPAETRGALGHPLILHSSPTRLTYYFEQGKSLFKKIITMGDVLQNGECWEGRVCKQSKSWEIGVLLHGAEGWVRALWVRGCSGLGRRGTQLQVGSQAFCPDRSGMSKHCAHLVGGTEWERGVLSGVNSGVPLGLSPMGEESPGEGVLCRKHFPEHQRGGWFLVSLFPGAQPELLLKMRTFLCH